MKQWPENNEPAHLEDITSPLADIIREAYEPSKYAADEFNYDGLNLPENRSDLLCVSHNISDRFKAENIDYHKERGRDLIDIVLCAAVNLGMEQGRRHDDFSNRGLRRVTLDMLQRLLDQYEFEGEDGQLIKEHIDYLRK